MSPFQLQFFVRLTANFSNKCQPMFQKGPIRSGRSVPSLSMAEQQSILWALGIRLAMVLMSPIFRQQQHLRRPYKSIAYQLIHLGHIEGERSSYSNYRLIITRLPRGKRQLLQQDVTVVFKRTKICNVCVHRENN